MMHANSNSNNIEKMEAEVIKLVKLPPPFNRTETKLPGNKTKTKLTPVKQT